MSLITETYVKIPNNLVAIMEGHGFVDPERIDELQNFLKSAKLNTKL
jgi:hypothetical protein